jgi:hypothetical protein
MGELGKGNFFEGWERDANEKREAEGKETSNEGGGESRNRTQIQKGSLGTKPLSQTQMPPEVALVFHKNQANEGCSARSHRTG